MVLEGTLPTLRPRHWLAFWSGSAIGHVNTAAAKPTCVLGCRRGIARSNQTKRWDHVYDILKSDSGGLLSGVAEYMGTVAANLVRQLQANKQP